MPAPNSAPQPEPGLKNCLNCGHDPWWRPVSPVSEEVVNQCMTMFPMWINVTRPSPDSALCLYEGQEVTNCPGWTEQEPSHVLMKVSQNHTCGQCGRPLFGNYCGNCGTARKREEYFYCKHCVIAKLPARFIKSENHKYCHSCGRETEWLDIDAAEAYQFSKLDEQ